MRCSRHAFIPSLLHSLPSPSFSYWKPHSPFSPPLPTFTRATTRTLTSSTTASLTRPVATTATLSSQTPYTHPTPTPVPDSPPVSPSQLSRLHDFVSDSARLVALTGAGTSTESGIPDYRSPRGAYSTGFKPMTHQSFMKSPSSRSRYWSRSFFGYLPSVAPSAAHKALARMERLERLHAVITQNVDRLHSRAGSRRVIELHGTIHEVRCLECGTLYDRADVQRDMARLNPQWAEALQSEVAVAGMRRPDGDREVAQAFDLPPFQVPICMACGNGGGLLKPDVVFFGDNIPKDRAAQAMQEVLSADALLVVGSSLMVLSAYRLARAAAEAGIPIAAVNIGPTRADDLLSLKVEARCGEVLPRLLAMGSLEVPLVR